MTASRLVAPLLVALVAAGCGSDKDKAAAPASVPAGGAAVVAGTAIAQDRFRRFVHSRATGVSPLAPGATQAPLEPPDFTACARAIAKQTPGAAPAERLANCRAQYEQARSAMLSQ